MSVVLIAYDGTSNARRAVNYAARFLAAKRVVVLTVWTPIRSGPDPVSVDLDGPPDPIEDDPEEEHDIAYSDALRTNEEGTKLAVTAGMNAEPMLVPVQGTIWRAIINAADRIDADLVVSGTRGTTGLRSLLQSSVADHVLRHGRRPVLIVPPGH
ncbi:hypothetical protein MCHIJ_06960 [Mycolicibacterium chitae]|uniref:UspA domain-containing protein n=1 Tax=Mycolicibacterium chitae TaxID=1792 RepID=A0A3S4TQ38_MYCCI|nr:universal stress protein [Mycolicibacterium chitae]MCV7106952.1 universal stress protein [Mycolicibacterium chitae]BBZ01259.1 hypothetical protein MCHIJ_06960 [Mycolicibacterium chitae]VEG50098.1 UspA domain-containing protein [Mycolicibacterium chitae]